MVHKKQLFFWVLTLILMVISIIKTYAISADESVESIHQDAIVVDTHNDTMMKVVDETTWLPVIDIGGSTPVDFQLNLQKAREGGLDVAFYAAYTDYQRDALAVGPRTNSRSLALIHALHWTAARNSEKMILATRFSEVEKGLASEKHVAMASLEGMYGFNEKNAIELLAQYYDLGIRAAGIVWNAPNALGAGTHVPNHTADAGLTELGEEVIREMNRLGIIVDVSHMNETTFYETMSVVTAPVIASHSGVDGVRPHVRNLSDKQLQSIRDNGGVVQINFWRTTVADVGQQATISMLVDHIDYVVEYIGMNHVGLGSDFDGAPMPVDLPNAAHLPELTAELANRGYSADSIKKILGGNTMEVYKVVEAAAEQTPSSRGIGFTILPQHQMGEILVDPMPVLKAKVIGHGGSFVDPAVFRVIVNGIPYEPKWNASLDELSYQVTEPLMGRGHTEKSGNFHVVTFEGFQKNYQKVRETTIFYVL